MADTISTINGSNLQSVDKAMKKDLEEPYYDMQHQNHCDKCIAPVRCWKFRKLHKNDASFGEVTCPIVYCPWKCGVQLHECKKGDHENICPKVKVPCVNHNFGCPFSMMRSALGNHLASCPASVVVCTMEYNRWPLPPGKCQPFAMDPEHLDVSACYLDQQTIKTFNALPSSLKATLRTYMNERNPVMPLGVSGYRIPKSIIDRNSNEPDEISEDSRDESSDSPWGCKRAPPGLQESVCHKLKALTFDASKTSSARIVNELPKSQETRKAIGGEDSNNNNNCSNVNNDGEDEDLDEGSISSADLQSCDNNDGWECDLSECLKGYDTPEVLKDKPSTRKEPLLNLTVEIISKYQCKPNSMYSFICAREFRRDELAGHFKHFHTEIHTQLNGWLFQRCPMANSGCSFGIHRMFPMDKNHRIVFNNALSTFSYTKVKSPSDGAYQGKEVDKTPISLADLPFELLVHITKFLDPLSLNSLAQVNSLFEDVCRDRLMHRGIVVLHWEKANDQPGWVIKEHKWTFSVSFSPISTWVLGDISRMANHMKTCQLYDRNIPSRPFGYTYQTINAPTPDNPIYKKLL